MAIMKWPLRVGVAAGLFLLLAYGARFTLGEKQSEGMLRLSWRVLGEQVRICREYTAGERSTLRQHMQLQQSCTTSLLSYRLNVRLGDREPLVRDIVPAGARADRPLYVKEDFLLPPGEHALDIRFLPISGTAGAEEQSEVESRALRDALEKAPRYTLERRITIAPGRIVLVDLDPEHGGFIVHGE